MLRMPAQNALKKCSIALLFFTTAASAVATTDWQKLVELAPYSRIVKLKLDNDGHITAYAMKMPNGHYRLIRFLDYMAPLKPRIYIENYQGPDSVAQLCKDSAENGKTFKAKMKFTVDAWAHNQASLQNIVFDNPFTFSPVHVDFETTNLKYTRIPGRPDYDRPFAWEILDYYRNLLNTEAAKPNQVQASIDLSDKNGFACDIMAGRLAIKITQQAIYETGAPRRSDWLNTTEYLDMFKIYWKTEPLFFNDTANVSAEDRAFVLGYKSSPGFANLVKGKVSRLSRLIESLVVNIDSLKTLPQDQWTTLNTEDNRTMTAEFSVPNERNEKQDLVILEATDGIAIRPTSEEQ